MGSLKVNFISLLLLPLLLSSCGTIFEDSIKNKQVNLLAPADNVQSSNYNQIFWWDPVDGALLYNIQIVSPDFNAINTLVVDTVISSTKFLNSMTPGTYQWRVKAINGSSETLYSVRNLTIDTTSISLQKLNVISPTSGIYSNTGNVTFKWFSLFGSTNYNIQIDTMTGNFLSPKVNVFTPSTSYNLLFKTEGQFQWRVNAMNTADTSLFSSSRIIIIDKTSPALVSLTSPSSNFAYTKPVALKWNPSTSSDVAKYKVYAYTVNSSDTTLISTYPKVVSSGTSFSFNDAAAGQLILWRITAVDFAENESSFSSFRNFKIAP